MLKKGNLAANLKLNLPPPDEVSLSKFLTESGTFRDGDLLVNRDGVRIVSHNEVETPSLIQPSDSQLSLADFDAVKVIGKGNGGVVRLVQHKWTGQFFALKILGRNLVVSKFPTIGIKAIISRNRISNLLRFDVEKFDGRINFGLWQVQVKDILIQSGLHKALKGKETPKGGAGSASGSKSVNGDIGNDANIVSLSMEDDCL